MVHVQLQVDPHKELQSDTLLGIKLERVYFAVNVYTFFIYTVQMSYLEGLYSSSGKASSVIRTSIYDTDLELSLDELRWLGCYVYNFGSLSYQLDSFTEGVPLLATACEELRVWCFGGKSDEEILTRMKEVI